MLTSLTMICSCQKQDLPAETQLAQRKTELDAREEAVVQREKAVEQREKAVAAREKALATSPIIQSQRHAPDAAQAEAERERRIQQLPPELRALIPDRSRLGGKARTAGDPAQRPGLQQDAQRKKATSSGITAPDTKVPEPDAASPSASPTPE
jgi:hypothetical protein